MKGFHELNKLKEKKTKGRFKISISGHNSDEDYVGRCFYNGSEINAMGIFWGTTFLLDLSWVERSLQNNS